MHAWREQRSQAAVFLLDLDGAELASEVLVLAIEDAHLRKESLHALGVDDDLSLLDLEVTRRRERQSSPATSRAARGRHAPAVRRPDRDVAMKLAICADGIGLKAGRHWRECAGGGAGTCDAGLSGGNRLWRRCGWRVKLREISAELALQLAACREGGEKQW